MTLTEATVRDLLLPGLAGLEGKFGNRVEADLEIDADGNLYLFLEEGAPNRRHVRILLADRGEIESNSYKNTFGTKAAAAFEVFDQLTRDFTRP